MKTTVAINQSQLELLILVAKYRFVSVSHIQKNFNYKSRTSVHNKLKRLIDAGLVGMQYDNTKKLSGIPAAFYLTPAGLRIVQTKLPYITDAIIRNSYADKNGSENLIQQSSAIFEQAWSLTRNYPAMKVLTARQLGDLEYFPRPLPDLYLAHKQNDKTTRYFLYYFRDVKRYDVAVKSGIQKLIAYREADSYSESGNEFPNILMVCDSAAIEWLVQRAMRASLNRSYESMLVYTTSRQALVSQNNRDELIWSSIDASDTLISLDDSSWHS